MPPPVSRTERVMSGAMKSMPATSRPTVRAARRAMLALSGWISSVRSIAVPPVERLAVARSVTISARRRARKIQVRPPGRACPDMVVDDDAGHHLLVADAATGILVHRLDQLGRRSSAVADHLGRHALGHGDDLAADHQDAIVAADILLLDDHPAAVLDRLLEAPADLIGRLQAQADAAAVIAVQRLETTGPLIREA
jgi:hypothetical protein